VTLDRAAPAPAREQAAPAPIIHLPDFDGPLDLLLTLVERRRLPIAALSLALVADQYLAQVRRLPRTDPELLAEFLVIGARLVLLKSRALLPQIEPPRDAEDDEVSAEELVRRLEVYRTFKLLAQDLAERMEGHSAHTRGAAGLVLGLDAPVGLAPIRADVLAELMRALVERDAEPELSTLEPTHRTTVAQRLGFLRDRLRAREVVEWRDVGGETVDELVATLLAILELVRRGEASVLQPALFGPIRLYRATEAAATAATPEFTEDYR